MSRKEKMKRSRSKNNTSDNELDSPRLFIQPDIFPVGVSQHTYKPADSLPILKFVDFTSTAGVRNFVQTHVGGYRAYYLSSGTSNEDSNFDSTYFPIARASGQELPKSKVLKETPRGGWLDQLLSIHCKNTTLELFPGSGGFSSLFIGNWTDRQDTILRKYKGMTSVVLGTIDDVRMQWESQGLGVSFKFLEKAPAIVDFLGPGERSGWHFVQLSSTKWNRTKPIALAGDTPFLIMGCSSTLWLKSISFLSKFGDWEQVQTSAILGGGFWEITGLGTDLIRQYALIFDFDKTTQLFVMREVPLRPLSTSERMRLIATPDPLPPPAPKRIISKMPSLF
jgi:hypothetical protein